MGNSIRSISDGVSTIATEQTWIEGKAIQQLQTTAQLPQMVQVVGMPDLHPGRGYPIGAAFFSHQRLYPALVGNDIGCGMALLQTDISTSKLNIDKLEKKLGNIDQPLEPEWLDEADISGLVSSGFERSLGTIGGGNHFAELQQLDEIYDSEAALALGLDKKQLQLLVHSGSRGLGQAILAEHIEVFGHRGIEENTPECEAYLARHQQALDYAVVNRKLIALRMLKSWRAEGEVLLNVHHNLVEAETVNGVAGWLHRKGATPSNMGAVIVPGSRGDYSYVVRPLPTEVSLLSLAHGAGRKWMRSECKERLSGRYRVEQLEKTRFGSRVICGDRQLIYQEAPEAYKPIDSVIEAMQQAGLIELIARLKPVLTYKNRGEHG